MVPTSPDTDMMVRITPSAQNAKGAISDILASQRNILSKNDDFDCEKLHANISLLKEIKMLKVRDPHRGYHAAQD